MYHTIDRYHIVSDQKKKLRFNFEATAEFFWKKPFRILFSKISAQFSMHPIFLY